MYIKTKNNQPYKFPYTFTDLRKDNPNTSFPKNPSASVFADYGIHSVAKTAAPECDSRTHRLQQNVELIDGVWTQTWQLHEIEETEASSNIRAKRNQLLKECDWTHMTDSPLNTEDKAAWASYRDALRDIPEQTGFPYSVQWPSEPQ